MFRLFTDVNGNSFLVYVRATVKVLASLRVFVFFARLMFFRQVSPEVKAHELFFVYGKDQNGQWVRGRFVGDINQQTRGVRENFTLVSSLHAYNLQQFAWWVIERKWFRVPPIQILADPFEARYFPKHYSIEGEPGPRPNPADIPYRRGDFVTIIAGGLDETGYVHAVCQHPCVVSVGPFKEHPPPTILYSVLSTARRFCCDTFYDEDLRGPKIDLPQKPPPQSCWWVREREFCENDDRVRLDFEYMKEPRKGFEINHIVSVQVPGLAERQPALVVKTWTSPDAPVYYEARSTIWHAGAGHA